LGRRGSINLSVYVVPQRAKTAFGPCLDGLEQISAVQARTALPSPRLARGHPETNATRRSSGEDMSVAGNVKSADKLYFLLVVVRY
jgi:hypothetical protein